LEEKYRGRVEHISGICASQLRLFEKGTFGN
jgi:hypothetical protein